MNTTAFQGLTDKKERLKAHVAQAQKLRKAEREAYYKNSERFTFIVLTLAGGELLLTALLFDYMVALNFILTRTVLWLLLVIALCALSRFMHTWIFLATHRAHVARRTEQQIAHRIAAIEDYESGVINDAGIRLLYQEDDVPRLPRLLRVSEFLDWFLYVGIMLASALIALIFV